MKKMKFYKKRTFSEKIDDTFTFLKDNWKVLFRYNAVFILPFSLIMAFFLYKVVMTPEAFQPHSDQLGSRLIFVIFRRIAPVSGSGIIVTWIMYALQFTLIKFYMDRENGLEGILWQEIKQDFFHNMKKLFILGIAISVILVLAVLAMILIAGFSFYSLFITIPLFIIGIIPFGMVLPYYLYHSEGVVSAVRNGYRLGWDTYWGLLAMGIVLTIITSALAFTLSIPWSICVGIRPFDPDGIGLAIALFVTGIIDSFGSYLFSVIPIVGQVIQYGHACTKQDLSVMEENSADEDETDSDADRQHENRE